MMKLVTNKGSDFMSNINRSDPERLLRSLNFEEGDRVPHLEFWVTSQTVYECVLGRGIEYEVVDARKGETSIAPEDQVEFAWRIGMDAVPCNFSWRPGNIFAKASDGTEHYIGGRIKHEEDLSTLDSPPILEKQLELLERYIKAGRKWNVGIFPNFTSFFDSTQLAMGYEYFMYQLYDNLSMIEKLMDIILEHQLKIAEIVCRDYKDDILFFLINDDIAHNSGLLVKPSLFQNLFNERMKELIKPAKNTDKKVIMHTDGKMDEVIPILYEIGINGVHPCEPESNNIYKLKEEWYKKIVIFGNIHTVLLAYGTEEEIKSDVIDHVKRLGPGGGYVLTSSTSIFEGIPPEHFLIMIEAVHKYGTYPL